MIDLAHGAEVNLGELRSQLTGRIAWLMIAASSLVMWRNLYVFWAPFPQTLFLLSGAVLLLGVAARLLIRTQLAWAWHLVVWGLTAVLIMAMMQFDHNWLPFLGVILVFLGAMLVQSGGYVTAGVVAAAA